MTFKKFLVLLLALVTALSVLSACGGDGKETDSKANSAASEAISEEASEENSDTVSEEISETTSSEDSETVDNDGSQETSKEDATDPDDSNKDPNGSESTPEEDVNDETTAPAETTEVDSSVIVTDDVAIRIGGLKGPTTMGLIKLMQDFENGKSVCDYEFKVEAAADAITPLLIKGELDMVAIPANVASVLYNKTKGAVQVLGINTLGVLYIVQNGASIENVKNLKGRTIYATGKGTTPEYTLRYILTENGLDPDKDVTIVWKSEATEVVAAMKSGTASVAMLPQPYVTVAQTQIQSLNIVLNLNDEWEAICGKSMVTGVTVVRKEFAEAHPELIKAFLVEYKASTEYVVENPAEVAPLVEEKIGVKAAVAQTAIPYCNIKLVTGSEMKSMLSNYLEVLFNQNAQSIGGAMPSDDFYYEA